MFSNYGVVSTDSDIEKQKAISDIITLVRNFQKHGMVIDYTKLLGMLENVNVLKHANADIAIRNKDINTLVKLLALLEQTNPYLGGPANV